jgi:acyl-CoA thioester hydrolase
MNGHPPATLAEGRHAYTLRVYYEDTDAGGVVYHASYLRFAERARTEALRDLGIPHAALVARFGLMFVVRRIKVDYLRPARLDESLTVVTEPLEVSGASVVLRQEVRGGAGTCAVLEVQLACVSPNGDKPARLPPEWRGALVAMRDARRGRDARGGRDARTGRDATIERDAMIERAARTGDKRGSTGGSGG